MWSLDPPTALVIMYVGLPKSTLVPPHGAVFCGSPRSFSMIHEVGSSSLKCAWATAGTIPTSAAKTSRVRVELFIDILSIRGTPNGTPQPSPCKGRSGKLGDDAAIRIPVPRLRTRIRGARSRRGRAVVPVLQRAGSRTAAVGAGRRDQPRAKHGPRKSRKETLGADSQRARTRGISGGAQRT